MEGLDPVVLDAGLTLAMEWGEAFLQPIGPRLHAAFPALREDELVRHAKDCRAAMERGHAMVGELIAELGEPGDQLYERFAAQMLAGWPWISRENLGRLYSQGCYYAMK